MLLFKLRNWQVTRKNSRRNINLWLVPLWSTSINFKYFRHILIYIFALNCIEFGGDSTLSKFFAIWYFVCINLPWEDEPTNLVELQIGICTQIFNFLPDFHLLPPHIIISVENNSIFLFYSIIKLTLLLFLDISSHISSIFVNNYYYAKRKKEKKHSRERWFPSSLSLFVYDAVL